MTLAVSSAPTRTCSAFAHTLLVLCNASNNNVKEV